MAGDGGTQAGGRHIPGPGPASTGALVLGGEAV